MPVTRYEVKATGTQMEGHPHAFTRIDVVHHVEGDVDVAAVERAIELSATKYCSVGSTLGSGITEVRHSYVLRTPDGAEVSGEVIVLGPNADLGAALAGAAS